MVSCPSVMSQSRFEAAPAVQSPALPLPSGRKGKRKGLTAAAGLFSVFLLGLI